MKYILHNIFFFIYRKVDCFPMLRSTFFDVSTHLYFGYPIMWRFMYGKILTCCLLTIAKIALKTVYCFQARISRSTAQQYEEERTFLKKGSNVFTPHSICDFAVLLDHMVLTYFSVLNYTTPTLWRAKLFKE